MPNKVGDYTQYGFDNKGKKLPDARQTSQAPDYQNTLDTQAGIDSISGSQIGAGKISGGIEFGDSNVRFDGKRFIMSDDRTDRMYWGKEF